MRAVFLVSLLLRCFPVCTQTRYADFVVNGSTGWLLTRTGSLDQADLRTMRSTIVAPPPAPRLNAIAKDTASNFVVAGSAGQIWRLNNQIRQWSVVATCPYASPYAPSSQISIISIGLRTKREWEEKPVWLLDRKDRLWQSSYYQE